MGSSGTGSFSDYSGSKPGAGSGNGNGGGGPDDRCGRAFSVQLQDVEHSDYFAAHKAVPPVGTALSIEVRKRLVAVTSDGLAVGNLPTQFNYLADCLAAGFTYVGAIRDARNPPPVATVVADFAATAP